jgi:hypothetical protein
MARACVVLRSSDRGTPAPAGVERDETAVASRSERRPRRRGIRIKAIDSQFVTIVGDGRGQAVYLFDREDTSKSERYGDCARA